MRKQVISIKEGDLRRIIKESVNRIIQEEIGDGNFPNPDALKGQSLKRVEQALYRAGFKMDEYGDDMYGNGVVYFTNDEGINVTISYPWVKTDGHRYIAGKISQADVY